MGPISSLNFDKAYNLEDNPAFIKELITNIKKSGHFSVGHWLKQTSTVDLMAAGMACNTLLTSMIDPNGEKKIGDVPMSVPSTFVLLVDILSAAEGLEFNGVEASIKRASLLDAYIGYEMLKRKGFSIKLIYENMSLSEDMDDHGNKPIIEWGEDIKGQLTDATKVLAKQSSVLKDLTDGLDKKFGEKGASTPPTNYVKKTEKTQTGTRTTFMIPIDGEIPDDIPEEFKKAIEEMMAELDKAELDKAELGKTEQGLNKKESIKDMKQESLIDKAKALVFGVISWIRNYRNKKIPGKMEQ